MNDMKLIMERFEAFSEKTLLQEKKKLDIYDTGWYAPFKARAAYAKIYRTIRAVFEKTHGQGMDADRTYKDEYTKKWFKKVHRINMKVAAIRASRATPVKPGDDPGAIAKQYAKNLVMQLEEYVPFFGFPKTKKAWRMANRAAVGYFRPYFTAAIKKMLQPDAAEPEAKLDTPQRKPGDIPVTPVRKPISPTDTTQQGGASGKIARTNRIIKKFGRRIGIPTADALNKKLGITGSEVTPQTIQAVKAFQEKYNEKNPKRKIAVDGLFGGQTARAFRRFKG